MLEIYGEILLKNDDLYKRNFGMDNVYCHVFFKSLIIYLALLKFLFSNML